MNWHLIREEQLAAKQKSIYDQQTFCGKRNITAFGWLIKIGFPVKTCPDCVEMKNCESQKLV